MALGDHGPILSDYHPNCWTGIRSADGRKHYRDARIFLERELSVSPGECVTVRMHPLNPDAWANLGVGDSIDVCEGSRVIGTAQVIEPLRAG
jgi:hypothetical protein